MSIACGPTYINFSYSNLEVTTPSDGGLDIIVDVEKTGSIDSVEVPRIHLCAPTKIPVVLHLLARVLVGLDRTFMAAG